MPLDDDLDTLSSMPAFRSRRRVYVPVVPGAKSVHQTGSIDPISRIPSIPRSSQPSDSAETAAPVEIRSPGPSSEVEPSALEAFLIETGLDEVSPTPPRALPIEVQPIEAVVADVIFEEPRGIVPLSKVLPREVQVFLAENEESIPDAPSHAEALEDGAGAAPGETGAADTDGSIPVDVAEGVSFVTYRAATEVEVEAALERQKEREALEVVEVVETASAPDAAAIVGAPHAADEGLQTAGSADVEEPASPPDVAGAATPPSVQTLPRTVGPVNHFVFDREPPVIGMAEFNHLLVWCSNHKVSDLIMQNGYPVQIKRFGRLEVLTSRKIEINELNDLVDAFVKGGNGRIATNREDLNFRYEFEPERGVRYSYRACITSVRAARSGIDGREFVFRVIPTEMPTLDGQKVEPFIRECAIPTDGMVIVTGKTGSGKSTLLAAILGHAITQDGGSRRLCTYEAPPEFNLHNTRAMTGSLSICEIGVDLKSFADGTRNALRRSPDLVLIGEARDRETIDGCLNVGNTGHTVYSTVHAQSVVATIPRMAGEWPNDERWSVMSKLIDSARLIIHQRLLPTVDGERTAVREYLYFTPQLRQKLMDAGLEGYYQIMYAAMADRSIAKPLIDDLKDRYEAGIISKKDYQLHSEDRS